MKNTISISPLTRIEGHLAVHAKTEPAAKGQKRRRSRKPTARARCSAGSRQILEGRDPLDAQQITQRICGVCPISHGIASIQAQEMAYGIKPTHNGRLLQNLILAANYLHSHILHFYHLAALDFVDVKAVLKYSGKDRTAREPEGSGSRRPIARKDVFPAAPFLPRYEGQLHQERGHEHVAAGALRRGPGDPQDVRRDGGGVRRRMPHSTALVPGGVTQVPTMERILSYRSRLKKVAAIRRERLPARPAGGGQGVPAVLRDRPRLRQLPLLRRVPAWTTAAASSSRRAR